MAVKCRKKGEKENSSLLEESRLTRNKHGITNTESSQDTTLHCDDGKRGGVT